MKRLFPAGGLVALSMAAVAASETYSAAEVFWPDAKPKVETSEGVRAERYGDEMAVFVEKCPDAKWPAAYFTFPAPRDIAWVGRILVAVTNRSDRPLRIGVKVRADTVQGQLPDKSAGIGPGRSRVISLPLRMEQWVFKGAHGLTGLKRYPAVGGGSSYTLSKTHAIAVYGPRGGNGVAYGVTRIELVPGELRNVRQRVLDPHTFYPWVDEFGQANFAEWPEKVHSQEELCARTAGEDADLAAHPDAIPESDRFGGWAGGPQLKATGRFRTEKVNGKWWLVDPDGHLFFAQGVNFTWENAATGVSGREKYFECLPPKWGKAKPFWEYHTAPTFRSFYHDPSNTPFWAFSFTAYNQWRKFGDNWRTASLDLTMRRLKGWGINVTTSTPGEVRQRRQVPFIGGFGVKGPLIETATGGCWTPLIDPFTPEFAESCRQGAERCRADTTNEFCVGWTSGNELSWGGDGAELARSILKARDDQPAKMALVAMLKEMGKTAETASYAELCTLGEAVADKYYSTIRAAIKAVSPDMLYLGDRNYRTNPDVFRAASRHLDVITVNDYDFQPTRTLPEGAVDKPFWVTEFHFGCYDTGYFYASLIPVLDQKARGRAYAAYVFSAVDNPNYVGANWFCWRDCPLTGQLAEGANAQCGLVSTTDIPYDELVKAMREVSSTMYRRRYGETK